MQVLASLTHAAVMIVLLVITHAQFTPQPFLVESLIRRSDHDASLGVKRPTGANEPHERDIGMNAI
jgi:hypothetical protein